ATASAERATMNVSSEREELLRLAMREKAVGVARTLLGSHSRTVAYLEWRRYAPSRVMVKISDRVAIGSFAHFYAPKRLSKWATDFGFRSALSRNPADTRLNWRTARLSNVEIREVDPNGHVLSPSNADQINGQHAEGRQGEVEHTSQE